MNVSSGTVSSSVGALNVVSTRTVWVLRCLCFAGLGISAYLAWTAINMVQAYGCGGGEVIDCGHVLNSKWSKVMGMPVSMPACGLYASLLIMLGFVTRPAPPAFLRMLWTGLTAGAFMAGLAALWFIGLQIFLLKHICPYCIAVHSCGIILTVLMLKNQMLPGRIKAMIASFSVSAVAVLITIQVMTPEAENFEVVRYPEENEALVAEDGDMFAPPEEIFEAPGELFEAPGAGGESDLVGTEAADQEAESASPPADPESTDSVKANSDVPAAAALLILVPPRLLQVFELLSSAADDAATTPPADNKVADAAATADADANATAAANAAAGADDATKDAAKPDGETAEKTEPAAEAKPEVTTPVEPPRKVVSVAGNRVSLDVKQWPLLGSPDARYVFVEMFDYTCPHCRNTHLAIKGAFEHFGKDLAIIALPVPLERLCNDAASGGHPGACELSRIAITVWRVNPSKFKEFHDWMFESTRVASTARAHAEKLVGAQEFKKEYDSKIPSEYIKRHVALYKRVGQGSVPKLLFPNSTINGEMNSKETLCRTIERELKTGAAPN